VDGQIGARVRFDFTRASVAKMGSAPAVPGDLVATLRRVARGARRVASIGGARS
jgi:hypothetical protein